MKQRCFMFHFQNALPLGGGLSALSFQQSCDRVSRPETSRIPLHYSELSRNFDRS